MPKQVKTNAMRILDGLNIPYGVLTYDDDGEHELSRGTANNTANKLGIDPLCCFKTIVMRTETREIIVFCQSAPNEINLKKARAAVGCKEISSVKLDELLGLVGYIRGACTPIGMKKKFRTFIDESVQLCDKVYISGGQRGVEIVLSPADLVKATDATLCDLEL